jgi:hypothetical protein
VASFAVEKPDKPRPNRTRIIESEGGKDEWQELDTYQGLTDTADTYGEYQASDFEVSEDYDNNCETSSDSDKDAATRRALELHLNEGVTQEDAGKVVGYRLAGSQIRPKRSAMVNST